MGVNAENHIHAESEYVCQSIVKTSDINSLETGKTGSFNSHYFFYEARS